MSEQKGEGDKQDNQRVTLVTGASRGIGREAVLCLAGQGHHVIALARSEGALQALDDEVRELYRTGLGLISLDLKDVAAIDALAPVLLERFGKLDGLLANAALLGPLGPLQQVRPREFESVLAVNLTANWRLIRALDPLLRASDSGRAVFVTSGIASSPCAYWGPYATSKAGLEAMIACYADEVKALPLRVNLFDPGPTATNMRREAMPGEDPATLPSARKVAAKLVMLLEAECSCHGQHIRFAGSRG